MLLLYPTETLYALGVNALDPEALTSLYTLKERDLCKPASWLVRSIEDIRKYAEVSPLAERLAARFLPGSLTLVLPALISVSDAVVAPDRTIAFRISSDPKAQEVITNFMEEYQAPLTCTSANVSGSPTLPTPGEILQQFGPRAHMVSRVIDDGPRKGLASTIVRVTGDVLSILREGEITEEGIRAAAA